MKTPPSPLFHLYRYFLALYPRDFRRDWGEDLLHTMAVREEHLRSGAGTLRRVRFWIREFWAVARTGIHLRLKKRFSSPSGSPGPGSRQPFDRLVRNLRFAFRQLLRRPGLTVAAVMTIALGIGANTAVFSVVSGILAEPLPYPEPERLVRVFDDHTGFPLFPLSRANFLDFRARETPFSDMALYVRSDLQLAADDRPEQLTGMAVSHGFFRTLGMDPILGRGFTRESELSGNQFETVLGYHIWERRFASDPGILGQVLTLSGRPFTVVGVAAPDLRPPGGDFMAVAHGQMVDLWLPLVLGPEEQSRSRHNVNGIARMKDGFTVEEAEANMKAIATEVAELYPRQGEACTVELVPLSEDIVGEARPMLSVLLGAAALILLIACVNVAGVMLARAAERRGEIAVRVAIGAGQGHILRQMLVEGAVVAVLGGVAGVGLAVVSMSKILALAPDDLPRIYSIGLDGKVLAFALVATAATALFAGLAPALHARGFNVANALQSDGGRTIRRAVRSRRILVVLQSGLAVILLVGAGLLLRSFNELRSVDPGFEPQGVLTAGLSLPSANYGQPEERARFLRELKVRLEEIPGVERAGITNALPWSGFDENAGFAIEGWAPPEDRVLSLRYHFVSPGYLESIGVPVVVGRSIQESDDFEASSALVINESAARIYWNGPEGAGEVLGSIVYVYGNEWTVVGIVGDVKDGPGEAQARPAAFMPLLSVSVRNLSLTLSTRGDPMALAPLLHRAVASIDPTLPLTKIQPLTEIAEGTTTKARFTSLLVGLFASMALLLAVVGLYGLMVYLVGQRNREIAVRRALGAQTSEVVQAVVLEGMALAAGGLVLGLAGSLVLTRLLASLLYGVSPFDPITLLLVAGGLLGVAGISCFLPARRAAGIQPMRAMR